MNAITVTGPIPVKRQIVATNIVVGQNNINNKIYDVVFVHPDGIFITVKEALGHNKTYRAEEL